MFYTQKAVLRRYDLYVGPAVEGARLAAAVHGAVHGGDGREVDALHVALEVRVLHGTAGFVRKLGVPCY